MKTWTIAVKDTLIRFRDRNAILLMIAAPLLIALIMGFAFGGQGDGSSPISEIALIIVNQDRGEFGASFAEIITGIEVDTAEGPKPLFAVTELADSQAAIEKVELGETRGVVLIPPEFSDSLQQDPQNEGQVPTLIQVFTDPAANVSPGIIRGVVNRIADGFSTVVIGNNLAVNQLLDTVTDIPVILVNDDSGPVSAAFVNVFSPENFAGLLAVTQMDDLEAARDRLETGEAQAVLHVTDGFSQAVMGGSTGEQVAAKIAVIPAPGSLSAPIVQDLAEGIARGFGSDSSGPPETPAMLANLENLDDILADETTSFAESEGRRDRIGIRSVTIGAGEQGSVLNYFVPSMAIFFLLFAVFDGTRSILEEERDGTLHRLMTTPTSKSQILLGKIGGTFLTGILQFIVLVLVSWLAFRVDWGRSPLGIALMVLATVAAATSLGAFIASFARDVNQAGVLGTAITLIFAILGGNFIDFRIIPAWLTPFSKATINRWALEGFVNLTLGGQDLLSVLPNIAVLFGFAALFFILAVTLFNRRFVK